MPLRGKMTDYLDLLENVADRVLTKPAVLSTLAITTKALTTSAGDSRSYRTC